MQKLAQQKERSSQSGTHDLCGVLCFGNDYARIKEEVKKMERETMLIEHKYKLGQEVWFIHHDKVKSGRIFNISCYLHANKPTATYKIEIDQRSDPVQKEEYQLGTTKQDLLNSL